jgi:uncharacterized protein YbjT (DUF2867 family)
MQDVGQQGVGGGVALAAPVNNTIEIAGPEPLRFEDFVRQALRSVGDQRVVVADPQARYFGARLSERAGPDWPGEPDGRTSASRPSVKEPVR